MRTFDGGIIVFDAFQLSLKVISHEVFFISWFLCSSVPCKQIIYKSLIGWKKFFFAVFRWNEIAMPLTSTFSILHCLITFFAIPTCKSSSFLLCNCVQSLLYFTRPSTEKKLFYRDWTLWTVSKINHKLIKYLYCSVWNDSRLHLGWQIEIFFSFSTVSDLRFTILVGVSLVFSPPLTMLLICALIFSTILIGCKRTSGTFINLIPIFCFRNLQIISSHELLLIKHIYHQKESVRSTIRMLSPIFWITTFYCVQNHSKRGRNFEILARQEKEISKHEL